MASTYILLRRTSLQLFFLKVVVFQFILFGSHFVECGLMLNTPNKFDPAYELAAYDCRFEIDKSCIKLRELNRKFQSTFNTTETPYNDLIHLFECSKKGRTVDSEIVLKLSNALEKLNSGFEDKNSRLSNSFLNNTILSYVAGASGPVGRVACLSPAEIEQLKLSGVDRISSLSTELETAVANGLKAVKHSKLILTQEYIQHELEAEMREQERVRLEAFMKESQRVNQQYLSFIKKQNPYSDYFTNHSMVAKKARVLIELRTTREKPSSLGLCVV